MNRRSFLRSVATVPLLAVVPAGVVAAARKLDSPGFWLGLRDGHPMLRIGQATGDRVVWDGSTLTIVTTEVSVADDFTVGLYCAETDDG